MSFKAGSGTSLLRSLPVTEAQLGASPTGQVQEGVFFFLSFKGCRILPDDQTSARLPEAGSTLERFSVISIMLGPDLMLFPRVQTKPQHGVLLLVQHPEGSARGIHVDPCYEHRDHAGEIHLQARSLHPGGCHASTCPSAAACQDLFLVGRPLQGSGHRVALIR